MQIPSSPVSRPTFAACFLAGALCLPATFLPAQTAPTRSAAADVRHVVPVYQYVQTLVAAEDMDERRYLAFPVTVQLDDGAILVGFKRGYAHAFDREASFDLLRLDPRTQRVRRQDPPLYRAGVNLQNGEFVRFANGDIVCYIDAQEPRREPGSDEGFRMGLLEFRSTDGGRTFRDVGRVGPIDGVEYGYVFEALTEGTTTWMLAMTFANLPGGRSVTPSRPKAGAVAVLRSDDHGRTWRRTKNLTESFGGALNESSFARYEDGFIFVCRPYASGQPVIVTDGDFNVRRRVDLVEQYDFVAKGIGRPRVFARDGRFYLLGRNTFKLGATPLPGRPAPATSALNRMRLSLLRFDPRTLAVEQHVVLDNAENQSVIYAYYATPHWVERRGQLYFNVVTYKRVSGRTPDIVRSEYHWDEVK